jgi:carbon monoxide dehydrogenase subunit G
MKPMTLSTTMNAPPEAVFAALTDYENMAGRVKGITRVEVLTPGPVGVGTKFKETRVMFKKEATETMEVTAFDPPRRLEMGCYSCGVDFRYEFRLTPEGSGTRVDLTMAGTAKTFFAKLMSPLAGMMAGMMKKCVEADMNDLKAHVEAVPVG